MKVQGATKPHMIIMVGIPSSGKSFFEEHFAETFTAPIISFDKLRKEIFTNPLYSDEEDKILFKVSNYILDEVLKTKRTVIYEGRTSLQSDRMLVSKIARKAGYEPLYIWVQTEPVSAKKRSLKSSLEKPALSSEEFDNRLKHFSDPKINEKAIVISGKHTYGSQLKIVLKRLIQSHPNDSQQNAAVQSPKRRNYLIR